MAETFTFDELSKPEEEQDNSYESLSQPEPESFSFEELGKRPTPEAYTGPTKTVSIPKIGAVQVPDIVRPAPQFEITEQSVNEPTFNLGDFLIKAPGEAKSPMEEGVNLTLRNTLNSLTTPKNIALMLGSMGIASTGQAAKVLVSALWAGFMGKHAIGEAPKIGTELGTELGKPEGERDYKRIGEKLTELGVNSAFAALPAVHAGAEAGKMVTSKLLSKTTEAPLEGAQDAIHKEAESVLQPVREQPIEGARGMPVTEPVKEAGGGSQPAPLEEVAAQAPKAEQARVLLTGEPPSPPQSIGKGIAGPLRAKWADATAADFPGSEAGFINIDPLLTMFEGIGRGVKSSIEAVKEVGKEALDPKRMTDYRRSVLSWSSKLQRSFGESASAQRDINKEVPDPVRREGITNWIQADGDANVLNARAAATIDPKLKKGYEAALKLTPEEIGIANDIRNTFNALANRGHAHDILSSFRENYVPQMWNLGKSKPSGMGASSRTLRDKFKFSRAKTFDTYFDGEQAGFVPKTKDIAKILPVYIHEMNSVIAARQLVMDMSKGVASDGRPLLMPRGAGIPVSDASGKATLITPKTIKGEAADYKTLESQPALSGWRWASKDSAGGDVFLKSDLAIHPEVYDRIRNVLGRSAIKEWYNSEGTAASAIPKALVKFLDIAQGETKKTMLGLLSPFHQVQEGTHAIGHRVNPFFSIPKIDLMRDAGQIDATKHGLMLLPDRATESSFMEGFKNSGIISKVPGIGKLADRYSHYTFEEYIPGLKYKTYEKILARNTEVFKKELASGELKPADVKVISAEQSNAAYGHLNYADLGRNPTIQHLARIFLLAPDFLEARARFAAQGAKGITGGKVGREQLIALGTLAFAQGVGSFLIAKAVGGEWDYKDPFSVKVGNRKYTMRSVPEDLVKLGIDPKMFVRARLSPLVGKGTLDYITGRNWKDEKVTAWETTKDLAKEPIPITLRAVLGMGGTSVSPMEQLAGAAGLKISKAADETAIHYAKVNEAIDSLVRKAKKLPRNERERFMVGELKKRGYWNRHAKTRIGRMYPGLYKYDNRND